MIKDFEPFISTGTEGNCYCCERKINAGSLAVKRDGIVFCSPICGGVYIAVKDKVKKVMGQFINNQKEC